MVIKEGRTLGLSRVGDLVEQQKNIIQTQMNINRALKGTCFPR